MTNIANRIPIILKSKMLNIPVRFCAETRVNEIYGGHLQQMTVGGSCILFAQDDPITAVAQNITKG